MPNPEYLSPEEVGTRFKASKWTVRRWIEAGKLPAVRVGRRWLIPKDQVERMQVAGIHPAAPVTYRITREPAPIYDGFKALPSEFEVDKLAAAVADVLHAGGWPQDNPEARQDALRKVIRGEESVPVDFWRLLARGILAIRIKE